MRRPILVANWKMNKTAQDAEAFAEKLLPQIEAACSVEIVIAPAFTALDRLARVLGGSPVELAAQDVSCEASGAHTGEVATDMLREFGCRYTIVGHSERRALQRETNAQVAAKAEALQAAAIRPIVCVGETLEAREAGSTLTVVGRQLEESLAGVSGEDLVVAYEPVWAIGTGHVATPETAQQVHGFIRSELATRFGRLAESIRIQYGGSVNPGNAAELMLQPDIDGALVGGASLEPGSFAELIEITQSIPTGSK